MGQLGYQFLRQHMGSMCQNAGLTSMSDKGSCLMQRELYWDLASSPSLLGLKEFLVKRRAFHSQCPVDGLPEVI